MNVLNLRGKLTPEQAAFFAPTKPEIELFDLTRDPHEVRNVANDPAYAEVKAELLAALDDWRKNVIEDSGIDDEFRGTGIFPDAPAGVNVDDWVEDHAAKYDFDKYGYPGWFPTRTLAEWEKARAAWQPWVFREPDSKMARPDITHPEMKPGKKAAGK